MGGWKRTPLTVYVVAWPDGVFKVGTSERQRWRRFVLRGAELVYLAETPDAYSVEVSIQHALDDLADRAFDQPEQAIPYLGDSGGYKECFRTRSGNARAHAQALPGEQCTYVRTYGRTH